MAALSALAVTAVAQDVDDFDQFKAAREREMSDYQSRRAEEYAHFKAAYYGAFEQFLKLYQQYLEDDEAVIDLMSSDDGIKVEPAMLAVQPKAVTTAADQKQILAESMKNIRHLRPEDLIPVLSDKQDTVARMQEAAETLEEIVKDWRSRFLSLGARFYWFCLPIKHYNCCNKLANDESFICWEPGKESVWVRPMPKFAIRNHKDFRMGMTYQYFGEKIFKKVPQMVGLRMAESVQRRTAISLKTDKSPFIYPMYDWKDSDVWLYIKLYGLQIPMTYIYLYKVGVALNKLRISQFFSIDTIKTLPKVLEFYPDLYERVIRREPNADLVMLYWDTDMFRSTKQDQKFDLDKDKDYRIVLKEEMKKASQHPDMYPGYKEAKKLYARVDERTSSATCKTIMLEGNSSFSRIRICYI